MKRRAFLGRILAATAAVATPAALLATPTVKKPANVGRGMTRAGSYFVMAAEEGNPVDRAEPDYFSAWTADNNTPPQQFEPSQHLHEISRTFDTTCLSNNGGNMTHMRAALAKLNTVNVAKQ